MPFKPTDDFVDYVSNSDNVWNPERYLDGRRCNGVHDGHDYNFRYSYTLGNAYMSGTLGKEGFKVEVYFQYMEGYQVVTLLDGKVFERQAFQVYQTAEVKDLLAKYATHGN
jgi:hypothetical protein